MIREVYLAGGCYWGTQKFLDNIQGVLHTEVGFANGNTPSPTYDQVKHDDTGYTETVHVQYDDTVIFLATLLELFFNIIDPTYFKYLSLTILNQSSNFCINSKSAFSFPPFNIIEQSAGDRIPCLRPAAYWGENTHSL